MTQLKVSFLLLAPQKKIELCVCVCLEYTMRCDCIALSVSSKGTGWSLVSSHCQKQSTAVMPHHSKQISHNLVCLFFFSCKGTIFYKHFGIIFWCITAGDALNLSFRHRSAGIIDWLIVRLISPLILHAQCSIIILNYWLLLWKPKGPWFAGTCCGFYSYFFSLFSLFFLPFIYFFAIQPFAALLFFSLSLSLSLHLSLIPPFC